MASSPQHKESQTLEYENTCQHEQLARDTKWTTSMEFDGDRANKIEPNNMDEMIRREAQDSGGTDNKIEESTERSEILVESFQLSEQCTLNHISEDNLNPEQVRDSAEMSTFVAGASNWVSFTDPNTRTETSGLETSSIVSVLNCEDNLRESASSQMQLVMNSRTSISSTSPALHLQHCEPSTSSVNPSTSFSSPIVSEVYAPAPDTLAAVSSATVSSATVSSATVSSPQAPDQVLSSQLCDSQIASPMYDGMMSPLTFMPPPPYTAQPPGYDTIQRTCSVSTISELQRSAPFPWEMPPSYDATRDSDRLCLVEDRRHRSTTTTTDWNTKNFVCCVTFAVVIFTGLVALGFFVNNAVQ